MSKPISRSLSEDGFAVIRGALVRHNFEVLETEFAELLSERIDRWSQTYGLSQIESIDRTSLRRGLLSVSRLPGFDQRMLSELDICLPHQPWSTIHADSPFHVGPALFDLVTDDAILDVIDSVVGPAITLSPNAHCRFKLPTGSADGRLRGTETP